MDPVWTLCGRYVDTIFPFWALFGQCGPGTMWKLFLPCWTAENDCLHTVYLVCTDAPYAVHTVCAVAPCSGTLETRSAPRTAHAVNTWVKTNGSSQDMAQASEVKEKILWVPRFSAVGANLQRFGRKVAFCSKNCQKTTLNCVFRGHVLNRSFARDIVGKLTSEVRRRRTSELTFLLMSRARLRFNT